ncbi:MAG: hypothetical protein KatS3mg111_1588 [Pirellulaceae bacterium]|nr:MAG: hypothetical protein KatS3mg111_1588 [Pirellulaceae bacterium]
MDMLLQWSLVAVTLVLVLAGWIANLIGVPGNWLIAGVSAACYLVVPPDWRLHVDLWVVLWCVGWAALGELIEFLAGAIGAKRAGGSRRSTVLAVIGSMAGGVIGLLLGGAVPVPIVGSLLGAVLMGGAGAFAGALLGERWAGKDWNASIQVGSAAFWGRLLGTVGKVVCGTAIAVATAMAILWP